MKCKFGYMEKCDPERCLKGAADGLTDPSNGHTIINDSYNKGTFPIKQREVIGTLSMFNNQIECSISKVNGKLLDKANIDFDIEDSNIEAGLRLGAITTHKTITPIEQSLLESLQGDDLKNSLFIRYEKPNLE